MPTNSKPEVASLGDTPKKSLILVRETYPLPTERKAIVLKIENILSQGLVQKIIIAVNEPIKVDRFTTPDQIGPQPIESPSGDVWFEARNGTIIDLKTEKELPALEVLYRAWLLLEEKGFMVRALFIPTFTKFAEWTGFIPGVGSFFGADLVTHKEMPEDAVLIVGIREDNALSIRVPMDSPKKTKGKK